jgi:hypothetical protein
MAAKLNTKDHRQRKNPKSAEAYQKEREKRNQARPKQVWDGDKWVRTTVEN